MSQAERHAHVTDDTWQQYWDGELNEADMTAVQFHMKLCATCRTAGTEWQQLFALIADVPDELLTAAEAGAIRDDVTRRIVRQRRQRDVAALVAAIALVPMLLEAVAKAASLFGAVPLTFLSADVAKHAASWFISGLSTLVLWLGTVPPLVLISAVIVVVLANMVLVHAAVKFCPVVLGGGKRK